MLGNVHRLLGRGEEVEEDLEEGEPWKMRRSWHAGALNILMVAQKMPKMAREREREREREGVCVCSVH